MDGAGPVLNQILTICFKLILSVQFCRYTVINTDRFEPNIWDLNPHRNKFQIRVLRCEITLIKARYWLPTCLLSASNSVSDYSNFNHRDMYGNYRPLCLRSKLISGYPQRLYCSVFWGTSIYLNHPNISAIFFTIATENASTVPKRMMVATTG